MNKKNAFLWRYDDKTYFNHLKKQPKNMFEVGALIMLLTPGTDFRNNLHTH